MKDLAEILEGLSSDVNPAVMTALRDATESREMVRPGDTEDSLYDIHNQLVNNRRAIERLEYLTSTLALLKSRTAQAVAARRGAYDDAYMKAATKPSVAGFGNDFTTAKEKDAAFNLAAMDEQLALRKAEAAHRDVESAWDYCRVLLRGAEGVQNDLSTRLRIITLTSQLER